MWIALADFVYLATLPVILSLVSLPIIWASFSQRHWFVRFGVVIGVVSLLFPPAAYEPFSGRALVFRRHGRQHLLYSIGPDGEDNGGKTAPEEEGLRWDRGLDVQVSSFSS